MRATTHGGGRIGRLTTRNGREGAAALDPPRLSSSSIRVAIWIRDRKPSLLQVWATWPSTVRSEMKSRLAISRLVRPSRTSSATSDSRRLRVTTERKATYPLPGANSSSALRSPQARGNQVLVRVLSTVRQPTKQPTVGLPRPRRSGSQKGGFHEKAGD